MTWEGKEVATVAQDQAFRHFSVSFLRHWTHSPSFPPVPRPSYARWSHTHSCSVSSLSAADEAWGLAALGSQAQRSHPSGCCGYFRLYHAPFSPTNGRDQVKTSMKFGSQYGCGEQLNCLMFMTLFSYFNTAAEQWRETKRRQVRLIACISATSMAFVDLEKSTVWHLSFKASKQIA